MGVMEGFLLLLSWGALQIVACVAPAFMPGISFKLWYPLYPNVLL